MRADEIAIIDADRAWLDTAVQSLMEDGYPVRVATRGEEASDLLTHGTAPALVVLEAQLPGFSGLHLLSEFRRRNDVTPVLIISDDDRASLRGEALFNGANGFLQKPLSASLLLTAVRRFLGNAVVHLA